MALLGVQTEAQEKWGSTRDVPREEQGVTLAVPQDHALEVPSCKPWGGSSLIVVGGL